MVVVENKGKTNSMHGLGRSFQTERLNESAYVEIHKSHSKMIGLIFHVGEFSLPLLRSRPYQRIHDRVERTSIIRPFVVRTIGRRRRTFNQEKAILCLTSSSSFVIFTATYSPPLLQDKGGRIGSPPL